MSKVSRCLNQGHLNVSKAEGHSARDNAQEGPVTSLSRVETMLQVAQGAKLYVQGTVTQERAVQTADDALFCSDGPS